MQYGVRVEGQSHTVQWVRADSTELGLIEFGNDVQDRC